MIRPPKTAYCAHHCRFMTDMNLRRRECLERMCRHLWWYEPIRGITGRFRRDLAKNENELVCMGSENKINSDREVTQC